MENKLPTPQKFNEAKKSIFERLISPALYYIGLIGAILMCIAYIAVVIVLVVGFKQHELKGCIVFAAVNAVVGLIIMQLLKLQGTIFAKNLPENKAVIDEYYSLQTKDKKIRSIKFYWVTSVARDICIKGVGFGLSTVGIIYIVIKGSNDYALLLLALVNLIMFICFGIVALNNAFEFFNNRHMVYLKSKIDEVKKENKNDTLRRNKQSKTRSSEPSRVQQTEELNPGSTDSKPDITDQQPAGTSASGISS